MEENESELAKLRQMQSKLDKELAGGAPSGADAEADAANREVRGVVAALPVEMHTHPHPHPHPLVSVSVSDPGYSERLAAFWHPQPGFTSESKRVGNISYVEHGAGLQCRHARAPAAGEKPPAHRKVKRAGSG
jgi:hypothetical protein